MVSEASTASMSLSRTGWGSNDILAVAEGGSKEAECSKSFPPLWWSELRSCLALDRIAGQSGLDVLHQRRHTLLEEVSRRVGVRVRERGCD